MTDADLGFVHRYERGTGKAPPTILTLHGTGGDEHDLVQLAQGLAPGAAVLSPRGKVLENGAPRFFRRLAEGVFDLEDVRVRAGELADFLRRAAEHYAFDLSNLIALGFSNGANMAAATMMLHPQVLRGGVLLRAMSVLRPDPLPDLHGHAVLISAGRLDSIVPAATVEHLADDLRSADAEVELRWQQAAHGLVPGDFVAAREWLAVTTRFPA